MSQRSNEYKLADYLMKRYSLELQDYLQRFEGTQPVKLWTSNLHPKRLNPEEVECNIDLLANINNKYQLGRLEKDYKIVGGFKKKVTGQEIAKLNYMWPNFFWLSDLLHKDIIEEMLKLCPEDFQPIPITLISQHKDVEPFENKDFYALNVLKCILAVDEQKSTVEWSENGIAHIHKLHYKENPWQEGCVVSSENRKPKYAPNPLDKPCMIAIDAYSGAIVWHPKLAKVLPIDPHYFFIRDIEQGLYL